MRCVLTCAGHSGQYLLELMATKILCLDHPVQLVGMSATLKVRQIS